MRRFLFALVATLALAAVRGELEVHEAVEVEDIEAIDVAAMLGDLFEDETEVGALRKGRMEEGEEEEKAASAEDLTRYNNFIDTVFRRMNSYARSRFDPLTFSLTKKSGGRKGKNKGAEKSEGGKKKGKKGRGGKNNKSGKGKKKGGKGKKGKKNERKGGKKSGNRHPKDLDLDEANEEEEEEEENEGEVRGEEIEEEEEEEEREKRDVDEEEEEEEEEEEGELERTKRDADVDTLKAPGKTASMGRRKGNRAGNKKGAKRGGGGKGKKGGNKKKGNKKGGKKGGKKGKKSGPKISRAAVNGIASMARVGDVKVVNKDGGKEIRASFRMGPVRLSVDKKFRSGKDSEVKTARATSPEMTGKMSIHVTKSGRAKVTKLHVAKPAIVNVDGSLQKNTKSGRSDKVMNRSLGKATPFALKKLKIAAREVLSSSQPKN